MVVGSWNHLLPIVDYKYMSIHMQRSPFCKALLFSMLGHIRAIRFQPCPLWLILQYRIGNCFFLELFACIWHFEYILIHLQFFTNTIQNIGFFLVYIVHFKSNISLFFKITSKFSMN